MYISKNVGLILDATQIRTLAVQLPNLIEHLKGLVEKGDMCYFGF